MAELTKSFKATGINGTIEGTVTIRKSLKSKEVHNHSTHDEEVKTFTVYDIVAVSGQDVIIKHQCYEDEVHTKVLKIEKELQNILDQKANAVIVPSLETTLKSLGYV